jgi:hypothetical protein
MNILEENPRKRSFDNLEESIPTLIGNDLYYIIIAGNFEEIENNISSSQLRYTVLPNGFTPYMLIIYLHKLFPKTENYTKMFSYIIDNLSIRLTSLEVSLIKRAFMLSILIISIELNNKEIFTKISNDDYSIYNELDIMLDTTPLMHAIKCNNMELIKYFIETIGVDIYAFNSKGKTALDIAQKSDNKEIIEYLMKK